MVATPIIKPEGGTVYVTIKGRKKGEKAKFITVYNATRDEVFNLIREAIGSKSGVTRN